MTSQVLFDAPGPKTIKRHRLYTILASLGLLAIAAFVVYKLYKDGQFEYRLWEPLITPKYISALGGGLVDTLTMAVAAIAAALVFGLAFGVGKLSEHSILRLFCFGVVEFFRAVPVLLLMVLIFFSIGIQNGSTGAYWSVVIALMLYNGAVLAEVFRAGINALPKGQAEAAYAIGMRKSQVMMLVQLPQAVKIMLPSIISQFVVTLKDTSLGYAIAAPGLSKVGTQIFTQFGNQLQTITVVALIYVTVNMILSGIATKLQERLVGEGKKPVDTNMDGGQNAGAGGGGI